MGRQETLTTTFGEMMDLISCLSIYEGNAEPARTHTTTDMATILWG